MTATDELRRMLDERGVKWRTDLSVTNKAEWTIWPSPWFREVWAKEIDGRVSIFNAPMTPAQAVEATLGGDLQAENDRLRELVRAMATRLAYADCVVDGGVFDARLRREVAKLGVEVDAQ